MYNLLGKQVRGRFGFPSGVIATNSDTARDMLNLILQLGFFVGKSTTIEPRLGNPEDIIVQESPGSLRNAVGYTNPGLEATIEAFKELIESVPRDIFLMPQIGESNEERFAYCASKFDKIGIDGIEINVSCPHADKGGILIGSDPGSVYSIVEAVRKVTKKSLVVKLNAGVDDIEAIAKAAVEAGASGISAINTLGGPNPELSNKFGGLSGAQLFPTTYETIKRIRKAVNVPIIAMGGIRSATDIRKLQEIDPDLFYAIGTALMGLDSDGIAVYFDELPLDLRNGTNHAEAVLLNKMLMEYKPFVVKEVQELSATLRLIRFYENIDAGPGQFVFLKVGDHHSKPFSVANDQDGLELVVRKITKDPINRPYYDSDERVGETTKKIFGLKPNNVVRIRGPYGKRFFLPDDETVVYVGAGCGIAPIHHAASHHKGPKIFVIGAKTREEFVYLKELESMGLVKLASEGINDGSKVDYSGTVTDLLSRFLEEKTQYDSRFMNHVFFNCGPEVVLKKAGEIEIGYTHPSKIYHLVERMTSCGTGICGKCSIPFGPRICVDGPVFTATEFEPGLYTRDKTGKKVKL